MIVALLFVLCLPIILNIAVIILSISLEVVSFSCAMIQGMFK